MVVPKCPLFIAKYYCEKEMRNYIHISTVFGLPDIVPDLVAELRLLFERYADDDDDE